MEKVSEFLPNGYNVPEGGDIKKDMKFVDGENRIRILASAVVGWGWTETEDGEIHPSSEKMTKGNKYYKKSVRTEEEVREDAKDECKHFWAVPVWSYSENAVKVLHLTQKSIQNAIKNLVEDDDWGSPLNYDLVINKAGTGLETRYTVNPKPAKELDADIATIWMGTNVNLDAIFSGGDPMSS